MPVICGGAGGLLILSIGLALAPHSSGAAVIGIGSGLLASLALPVAFVALLIRARLSPVAASAMLVELTGGGLDLQDALRRTLGDPGLELVRARELRLPGGERRVATPIRHDGERVGVLVHDASLRMRPELLDAATAAAGFALSNEHVESRNRALMDVTPDPMILVDRNGTYLDVHADDVSGLVLPPEQLIGRNVRDLLPPELTRRVLASIERALAHGESAIEYELEVGGVLHWKESRMVASGENEVVTIVRDFTEQRRAQAKVRRLAAEQAALRRVATLVAGDSPPDEVFQTVTEEVCRLLDLRSALMLRYLERRRGDDRRQVRRSTRRLPRRLAARAHRGSGGPRPADRRPRPCRLQRDRERPLGSDARARVSRERRRSDQRGRRHLGCPDRGNARAGRAARRDRAPAPGVRRAGGPGRLERAGAGGAGRLAAPDRRGG